MFKFRSHVFSQGKKVVFTKKISGLKQIAAILYQYHYAATTKIIYIVNHIKLASNKLSQYVRLTLVLRSEGHF